MLNNGLQVTGNGGEDSISNLHVSKLVGSSRTYVYTGSKGLDARAWLDGMRAGRAFMTNGPLVELTVNGKLPGEECRCRPRGGTVDDGRLGASRSRRSTRSMLIANGELVEEIPLTGDRKSVEFTRQGQGLAKRLVSPARRGKAGRTAPARHRLRAGIHQPRLGDGR